MGLLTEYLYVFEAIAAACAMTGSVLVTYPNVIRRRQGFVFFLISSLCVIPVMFISDLLIYCVLQVFYLGTSTLGLIRAR